MPMPQLTERIKEAPAMVLRAVFAGVGQLLLAVDKIRHDVLDHEKAPETPARPGQAAGAGAAAAGQPPAPAAAGNVRVLHEEKAAAPPAAAPAAEAAPETAAPETAAPEAAAPEAAAPETAAPETVVPETAAPETAAPEAKAAPETATPEAKAAPEAAAKPAARKPAARKPAATRKPAAAKPPAAKPPAAEPAGTAGAPLPNYDELTIASLRARLRGMDAAQVRTLLEYERAHAGREAVVAMYERRLAKIEAEAS